MFLAAYLKAIEGPPKLKFPSVNFNYILKTLDFRMEKLFSGFASSLRKYRRIVENDARFIGLTNKWNPALLYGQKK